MVNVEWVGMTRPHFRAGRLAPISVLCIHATAGTNSYGWLRQGGTPAAPISCHYLISKAGQIWQFVKDEDTAWHAGASKWRGLEISGTLNPVSLGIELENRNTGADPYPDAQVRAAVELSRALVARYAIPRQNLVRHLDVSPGRKTDPRGFDFISFLEAVYAVPPPPEPPAFAPYTAESPIMAPPRGTAAQACAWLVQRTKHYSPQAVVQIVAAYERLGRAAGVDWFLALAQSAHETDHWRSALSARQDKDGRPLRNPAGLGIWESKDLATPYHRPGTVWDADVGGYCPALGFIAWTPEEARWTVSAIEAHLGRLIAYALPPGHRFGPQVELADKALSVRDLPLSIQGSAPVLRLLGAAHNPTKQGWAYPGTSYGQAIARLANAISGRSVAE